MLDVIQIQKILPHRYPFLLVDRITKLEENRQVQGYKNITIGEQVFEGHFPNHPIYPGVLIIEGLAQAGGILAFRSMGLGDEDAAKKVVYFMSIDKAKFRNPVKPGDRLDYKLEVIKHKGNIWVLQGHASVDGKAVAEAELKAMIVDR